MESARSDNPGKELVAKLRAWRQGDYALAVGGFFYGDIPATGSEEELIEPIVDDNGLGLVVISQTCDIISGQATVAVCPLAEVSEETANMIEAGKQPDFAVLEHAPAPNVVADLSRAMSVSKELLIRWDRIGGFTADIHRLKFASCLERKFGRFAFPDRFNRSIRRLHDYIREKYRKDSAAGKAIRSLREIRVRATPQWQARQIQVTFIFVLDEPAKRLLPREEIHAELDKIVAKVEWEDGYSWANSSKFILGDLDILTARDIQESYPLDYAILSLAGSQTQ